VEKRILRLPVHPTSVIVAACMSVIAVILMLLMSPIWIMTLRMANQFAPPGESGLPAGFGAGMGLGMLVFMPVLYFIMTYLTTAIFLLVFNFVAPKLGGVPVVVADPS
jgi:hypothetical protein